MIGQISRVIRDSLKVGFLLMVPALIAWLTGRPFIFPSLGPSAFSLVFRGEEQISARHVIGGHFLGVAAGYTTFHLLAFGFSVAELPSGLSPPLLRLAASGVVSVILTSMGMVLARARHPPACATTMIVSLGLLSTFWDAVFIMLAISVMYAVHKLLVIYAEAKQP